MNKGEDSRDLSLWLIAPQFSPFQDMMSLPEKIASWSSASSVTLVTRRPTKEEGVGHRVIEAPGWTASLGVGWGG